MVRINNIPFIHISCISCKGSQQRWRVWRGAGFWVVVEVFYFSGCLYFGTNYYIDTKCGWEVKDEIYTY